MGKPAEPAAKTLAIRTKAGFFTHRFVFPNAQLVFVSTSITVRRCLARQRLASSCYFWVSQVFTLRVKDLDRRCAMTSGAPDVVAALTATAMITP